MKLRKLGQFKKQMRSVTLPTEQKETGKEHLVAFMQKNKVRINEEDRLLEEEPGKNLFLIFRKYMYVSLATLLVLITGSGSALAAENTLPGDVLYPVKVHINEPVRSALALSIESKANWETKVAERRLDEATRLATTGKLSAEAEAKLEAKVEKQTEKIQKRIEKLEKAGNEEVAADITARLESALEIHGQILAQFKAEDEVTKEEIKPLLQQLQTEAVAIHKLRTNLDLKTETKAEADIKIAAENRMRVSQKQIDQTKEYLKGKNVSATSSAQLKLESAIKVQSEGKAKLDEGKYKEAFNLFVSAQRLANEAKFMVKVHKDLKFDTRVEKIFKDWDEKKEIERREFNSEREKEREMQVNLENRLRINSNIDPKERTAEPEEDKKIIETQIETNTGVDVNLKKVLPIL